MYLFIYTFDPVTKNNYMQQQQTQSKYTEAGALQSLQKKHDVRIKSGKVSRSKMNSNKLVTHPAVIEVLGRRAKNKANDLGNGSWAKIGYLTRFCNYSLVYVSKFD